MEFSANQLLYRASSVNLGYVAPSEPTVNQAGSIYCPGRINPTENGGAGGIRTRYLFNAIEALSQLSYSPDFEVCSADLEGQTPNQKIVAQG
jgi:hypothetical protein